MTRNSQSNPSTNIDAANPVLLVIGCVLTGMMLLIFGPAMPIFMALLALAPAMVASEKGGKPLNWYCYGFMVWIVAIIHAIIIPNNPEKAIASILARCKNWCNHCCHFEYYRLSKD